MRFNEGKIAELTVKIANLPTVIRGKADWLKAQFDAGPEQLRVAHNQLIDDLQDTSAAGLLGALPPAGLPETTPKTVQGVLDAVQDGASTALAQHTARTDNPHGVTAAQVGAYSRAETDAAIGQKVAEIGAGDMAQAVYDPTGRQEDIFAELDGLQDADASLSARVTGLELGGAGQNVAGYVGEITYFADAILRKNHVWADGAPIDATQWPDLAAYAATAGWAQNEAGQYLTPDLRGRFLLGASATHTVGSTGGEEMHILTVDEMPQHAHSFNTPVYTGGVVDTGGSTYQLSGVGTLNLLTTSAGNSHPHNNMPPFFTATPQIRAKVDVIISNCTCPYEVGDILQTKSATPPNKRWPGTEWAAIETFLLGASASHALGSTGGSETVTLTIAELPAHRHMIYMADEGTGIPNWGPNNVTQQSGGSSNWTGYTGSSKPHNNMPPYTAVYIWERTA